MPRHFDPALINEPFDDPGLYVDLVFEKRALLFDLGDLARLSPRKMLRISDVFVTHLHMDHFAGFDQLLRRLLGREMTLGVYGPLGIIDAVEHKLKAYSWNLIGGYEGNLTFRVTEMDESGRAASASFSGRTQFARRDEEKSQSSEGVLLKESGIQVRATTLDHGLPVLAFALEERAHINIWRNKLAALGLAVGPWLRAFKEATLGGANDSDLIKVAWAEAEDKKPDALPFGMLKKEIMKISSGRKIAYVVDCAYTERNIERIVKLAKSADTLFIEGGFLERDSAAASQRRHLTARQAGTIARRAGVKRLVTFHYSPRYKGESAELAREAQDAFLRAGSEKVDRLFR
ncbi:ribonuclease Z [Methylocystis suflitae]|uniref:ribonuclease Z n=1 Tax=Methylocystis suflitae TaxID=2951405 RepID=UPI00210E3AFE|nr:MBL fold metallo-hydrolase [Methylocystis suflitae]MCQ4191132.1 MBL fold metallo-hydrolase [Methylocystis suflitae]